MKIFTGKASRAEVYGAIMVVSVLFAGGIGGAAIIASDTTSHITADTSTSTTSTDTQSVIKSDNTPSVDPGVTTTTFNGPVEHPGYRPPPVTTTTERQYFGAPVPTTKPKTMAITPKVVGMTVDEAMALLLSLNIGGGIWYDYSCVGPQYPDRTIVRQSPPPGTPIVADWNPLTYTGEGYVEGWMQSPQSECSY